MPLLQRVLLVLFLGAQQALGEDYGLIDICEVQYVAPGTDFEINCRTDNGLATKIYTPLETIPTKEGLDLTAKRLAAAQTNDGETRRITTINEYENATLGEADGYYTCYVIHGEPFEPAYSLARCQVIVQDICKDNDCGLERICEANYDDGSYECTCNLECAFTYDPVCTNRCELFFNPCSMREQTCKDGLPREIKNRGFCPDRMTPVIREFNKEILVEDFGETIVLTSGVVEKGEPPVEVSWEFYHEDGSDVELITPADDPFQLTVDDDTVGTYHIKITQCLDDLSATINEYTIGVEEDLDLNIQLKYMCSIYPGGGVDAFDGSASYYDLACTHVLAADFRPKGAFTDPWFIYGTFDQHDGNTALNALTFYLGRNIFEVQRGWLIHVDGVKMVLEENVPQPIGSTDCRVTFKNFHMIVDCPQFKVYYDGVMSGHIGLNPGVQEPYSPPDKKGSNVGLCWDSNSGAKPNWQMGRKNGECQIDTSDQPCADTQRAQCDLEETPFNIPGPDVAWTACGTGAAVGCGELYCGGLNPTSVQKCALEQAKRVSCALKFGNTASLEGVGQDLACPTDSCAWKLDILARGCPQENPPFVCGEVDKETI